MQRGERDRTHVLVGVTSQILEAHDGRRVHGGVIRPDIVLEQPRDTRKAGRGMPIAGAVSAGAQQERSGLAKRKARREPELSRDDFLHRLEFSPPRANLAVELRHGRPAVAACTRASDPDGTVGHGPRDRDAVIGPRVSYQCPPPVAGRWMLQVRHVARSAPAARGRRGVMRVFRHAVGLARVAARALPVVMAPSERRAERVAIGLRMRVVARCAREGAVQVASAELVSLLIRERAHTAVGLELAVAQERKRERVERRERVARKESVAHVVLDGVALVAHAQ